MEMLSGVTEEDVERISRLRAIFTEWYTEGDTDSAMSALALLGDPRCLTLGEEVFTRLNQHIALLGPSDDRVLEFVRLLKMLGARTLSH